MTDFKAGDKVRIEVEGEVAYAASSGYTEVNVGEGLVTFDSKAVDGDGTITKIVPPFKAGDVVTSGHGSRYLLLQQEVSGRFKYLSLQTHNVHSARFDQLSYTVEASIEVAA